MKNKLKIALCHQSIYLEDAIGHDILGMYKLLNKMGIEVILVTEYLDKRLETKYNTLCLKNTSRFNFDILLYHHSIHWQRGEELLRKFSGDIIFKFHNITPATYFTSYSFLLEKKCKLGELATKELIQRYANHSWLADSHYNKLDLIETGLDRDKINVVAPFNKINLKMYARKNHNQKIKKIIFTGRFVPNKGHKHLINILKAYVKNFSSNIELQMVGVIDCELEAYFLHLLKEIHKYKLEDKVRIFVKLPQNKLMNLYQNADVFMCMSEHEGFCVPIIEAQAIGIPVIAANSSAIPETIGYSAGKFPKSEDDYIYYASMLDDILKNSAVYQGLVNRGLQNVMTRFLNPLIETQFVKAIYPTLMRYI